MHNSPDRRRVAVISFSRTGTAAVASIIAVCLSIPAQAQKNKKEAPQPTVTTLTAAVPSLAPVAESPQTQTKGGLRITLTPEAYEAKGSWTEETQPAAPPRMLGFLTAPPAPNAIYVEKTRVPHLTIKPENLVLHIHLDNQLPRVFRGSGIAVQFNVAGKVTNVDPSGYGDLTNMILPPRSEQEITIIGPKITAIPAPSTLGIFFYDVVTNMDQAGNVTEKQNFEWYFSYATQAMQKEFTVPPPQQMWTMPGQ